MKLQKNNTDLHQVIPDLDCKLQYSILTEQGDLHELDTEKDVTMYGILIKKECKGEVTSASVHKITSKYEYASQLLEKLAKALVTPVTLKCIVEDELQK